MRVSQLYIDIKTQASESRGQDSKKCTPEKKSETTIYCDDGFAILTAIHVTFLTPQLMDVQTIFNSILETNNLSK